MALLALVAAGCAPLGGTPDDPAPASVPAPGGLLLSYADVLAPQVYRREGAAIADAPNGAPGLWAVTPGLPRPERGRIENLATGAAIEAALFAGRGGPGGAIRLSAAAAAAIGIGTGPAPVKITALRREPRLSPP